VLRAKDGAEVLTLAGYTRIALDVEFSPDGELVGKLANTAYAKGVYVIDFSPDGALLASGSMDGKVCIWDIQSQAVARNSW
jgi:hypothetical protein